MKILEKIKECSMRFILTMIVFIIGAPVYSEVNQPTFEEVKTWDVENSTEKFEFYDPMLTEIYLVGSEKAYLIPVSLPNTSRNSMFKTALVIPSKKKVISLQNTIVKSVEKVSDVDGNNVSEIFVKNSESGQGAEVGEKAIVQLNSNGNVIVLKKATFENNEGYWGKNSSSYVKRDVAWEFVSGVGNGVVDLVETNVDEIGVEGSNPKVSKSVKRFHFNGLQFIEFGE